MKTISWLRRIATAVALCSVAAVQAQTSAGAGSVIVLPVVAFTQSFTSFVFVQNPNLSAITLDVQFYESNNSNAPGFHDCGQFSVPGGATVGGQSLFFSMLTQCPAETGSTHFGMLILRHHDPANQDLVFYAYSRAETLTEAVGFSIEGFPIGNFSGATSNVLGLRRSTTGPTYLTHCYVGALAEAVSYKLTLFDGNDGDETSPLGSVSDTLQPFDSHRWTDVFVKLGALAGTYSNVRAKFEVTSTDPDTGGTPAYIGFCTVQESIHLSADFRIAKSRDALDQRQKRLTCYGQTTCGTLTAPPTQVSNPSTDRNVHSLFIAQPDFVKCDLVGDAPTLAKLQMRIREPGDVQNSPVFVTAAPYNVAPFTAGGASSNDVYFYTGERSEVNGGSTARWFIDVEAIDSTSSSPALDYGITCVSGNGVSVPFIRTVTARILDASF